MKRLSILSAFTALTMLSFSGPAASQSPGGPKSINTGGSAGAYHSTFCPPIPRALENAYFNGYQCNTSAGTVDNIGRVMANPTSLGFVQLDVYARMTLENPEVANTTTVVRNDIACEGLWMVTKNSDLDFGKVLGLSRRIKFVLPAANSGSTASFNYLRSIDPQGLGRAPDANITYMPDTTSVINRVAESTENEVGFFVQFADPRNTNLILIQEKGLRVIPVISREIMKSRIGDGTVYRAQTFTLNAGGVFSKPITATTSCTPVALITGNPAAAKTANDKDDAQDLITKIREIPREKMLPQDSFVSTLLKGATYLSNAALDKVMDGVDATRKALVEPR